jgi:signal transduction histidine kinase
LLVYENGKKIVYSIDELDLGSEYTVVIINSTAYIYSITNTHVPNRTSVNVTKVWDDDNNRDKDRDDGYNHGRISPHLTILGDPERIAQVLSNLLRNAIKFTKEGTINVTVGRKDNHSSSEAIVSISDSGQGIDPEVMPKLFEKFVSKSEKGTGLGLFISKSIVKAHGGKIWGENNKNVKGATFTFTLPLAI